mgnify:CR=1 FL=1
MDPVHVREASLVPAPTAIDGPRLLAALRDELPVLSPKLRGVAQFCLQHASTLHRYRIHDVADACGTVPASIVRLAQRFGLAGFQDLKLAFVGDPACLPAPRTQPGPPPAGPGCAEAARAIEAVALGVERLDAVVRGAAFRHAVQGLRSARRIRFEGASEADHVVALHLRARLRAVGCLQVDAADPDDAGDGLWWVQVVVSAEPAPDAVPAWRAPGTARALRLVPGPVHAPSTRADAEAGVTLLPVGGAAAHGLMFALALCEALAAALAPVDGPSPPMSLSPGLPAR